MFDNIGRYKKILYCEATQTPVLIFLLVKKNLGLHPTNLSFQKCFDASVEIILSDGQILLKEKTSTK